MQSDTFCNMLTLNVRRWYAVSVELSPLLNNRDVVNELHRLRHVHSDGLPACRNDDCDNFGLSVHTHKHLYHAFGYSGDRQRYRCKVCQSTFVDKWSGANKSFNSKRI